MILYFLPVGFLGALTETQTASEWEVHTTQSDAVYSTVSADWPAHTPKERGALILMLLVILFLLGY